MCSVTGSTVLAFNGNISIIPDRCRYSLLKPEGNSDFEILAGFQERRRLDVPFLSYLIIQSDSGTIHIEQGRVQVKRTFIRRVLGLGSVLAITRNVLGWSKELRVCFEASPCHITMVLCLCRSMVPRSTWTVCLRCIIKWRWPWTCMQWRPISCFITSQSLLMAPRLMCQVQKAVCCSGADAGWFRDGSLVKLTSVHWRIILQDVMIQVTSIFNSCSVFPEIHQARD